MTYLGSADSTSTRIRVLAATLLTAGFAACSGQLSLSPEETVRPGDALGFEFIVYVTNLAEGDTQTQQVLEVEASGRTFFSRSVTVSGNSSEIEMAPFRFISDEDMLRIRTAFSDSDFFAWSDSIYGDPDQTERTRKTIVYQEDGRNDDLQRIEDAPVPPGIDVLFDTLDILILESRMFDVGAPATVTPFVSGVRTRIDRPDFAVVKTTDDLVDLVRRIGSEEISVLNRVDFSREMVVAVFLGDVNSRVLGVSFLDTAYESNGVLKVQFNTRTSANACTGNRRPYALARVPRTDSRVEFYQATEAIDDVCP